MAFVFCEKGDIILEKNIKLIKPIIYINIVNERYLLVCSEKNIQLIRIGDSF